MALREKVVRKKAQKFELKGLQKHKVNLECIPALEEILHDIYAIHRPKPGDYNNRRDLVRVFNEIAKEIYGNSNGLPVVEEFGSFSMDLFTAKSDLDISVNFNKNAIEFSREKKIQTIRKFAKKFYAFQSKGHVSGVHPITSAIVPVLKVVDCGTGIECDISVENRDGIAKSHIVRMISSIDERFHKLSFLMKVWAKAQDINSSKDRTLNSLSIVLLVAFHLQTRDPPILPPFSAIFEDGTDPAMVEKLLHNFLNYGERNKESLAELFVTLLIKLSSVENLWPKGLCASTYEGSWLSKTWDSRVGCISVEDFTNRSQNVARAVSKEAVKKIYKSIQRSISYVFAFMDGQIQISKLREFLFDQGAAVPTTLGTPTTHFEKNKSQPCRVPESIPTKRTLTTEEWGGTHEALPFDPNLTKKMRSTVSWGGTPREGWGVSQQNMSFGPILPKTMQSTGGGWRGTHTGSWGGATSEGWGRSSPAEGWGPWG